MCTPLHGLQPVRGVASRAFLVEMRLMRGLLPLLAAMFGSVRSVYEPAIARRKVVALAGGLVVWRFVNGHLRLQQQLAHLGRPLHGWLAVLQVWGGIYSPKLGHSGHTCCRASMHCERTHVCWRRAHADMSMIGSYVMTRFGAVVTGTKSCFGQTSAAITSINLSPLPGAQCSAEHFLVRRRE